jgi:hypothetical protein
VTKNQILDGGMKKEIKRRSGNNAPQPHEVIKINGKGRESERLVSCFDLLQRGTHPLKRRFDVVPARMPARNALGAFT